MKKLISYSFVILAALSIMIACRKGDNPKLKGLTIRVPEPQLTKDPTTDKVIAAQTPDAFSAKFTVGLYFASDSKPKSMDVVIIKNGDHSVVKTLQAGVTTYPTVVTVTGTELKTLFGVSTALGDSYTIGVNITTADGTYVPAFSPLGSAVSYDSGVTSQGTTGLANSPYPPATPEITYTAICTFDMAAYGAVGTTQNYVVQRDDWADYPTGTVIPVKIIDATHLSFRYATDQNPKDIVITIDPTTNGTSATKQDFGTYTGAGYPSFFAASVPSADDVVKPCDLIVSIDLNITVSAGSYGNFTIVLQKQ